MKADPRLWLRERNSAASATLGNRTASVDPQAGAVARTDGRSLMRALPSALLSLKSASAAIKRRTTAATSRTEHTPSATRVPSAADALS